MKDNKKKKGHDRGGGNSFVHDIVGFISHHLGPSIIKHVQASKNN